MSARVGHQGIVSYQPLGAAREIFLRRDSEVLISGPAGTGKSRAALEKLHLCGLKYDRMRGLIVRKTRESLTESALVTFEEKVLPANSQIKEGAQRRMRQAYRYPNKTEIVVGGLDKPSKLMSTEFDIIYVMEATELEENDWESLITRLRNGVVPYQQLIGDCNPGPPSHWLKKRAGANQTALLESRHEDNPEIWDRQTEKWTPKGQDYITKLDALTGVRKLRLRYGIWAAAEGMVYEEVWDPRIHLIDRFEIPAEWPRYWVVDFGYTNPFVWQAYAVDPDGRLYRYREIYFTQRLVEDHARAIKSCTQSDPLPQAIICDHDAEDRATLERHLGLETMPAKKAVSPGLQAVSARLRVQPDGKARLFYLRESRIAIDPRLIDLKKPTCTEEEFEGYIWDVSSGRSKGEEPIKKDDHGMDATRYMVMELEEDLYHPSVW